MFELLTHSFTFFLAALIIFACGGVLVHATDRIAKRLRQDGFIVAFVLLGTLTSLSEMSVALNATLQGVPQVSAGNLIGASFVIFLFIIPFLALFGKGITLQKTLAQKHLLFAILVIGSPALFLYDGVLTRSEGAGMVLFYALLVYYTKMQRMTGMSNAFSALGPSKKTVRLDMVKIFVAAVLIFVSGRFLVTEAVYFSHAFHIPPSFIGLLIISLGTNMPELVIAIRAIMEKRKSIAFGDYIGSAAFNTLTLGVLSLANGRFTMDRHGLLSTSIFFSVGLALFFLFSRSKHTISRFEGLLLAAVYLTFVVVQGFYIARMAAF
ncbi:MAG TPA: sodium:calcium antiporter [Candidatus Kapabacteria bacterium]|nr:sodium:calcium antiporter [Candidatus Kapabacteria bacterium]